MRKNHGWAAFWQKKQYIIAGTLVILAAVGMTVLYSRGQEQERKQLEQEIVAEMDTENQNVAMEEETEADQVASILKPQTQSTETAEVEKESEEADSGQEEVAPTGNTSQALHFAAEDTPTSRSTWLARLESVFNGLFHLFFTEVAFRSDKHQRIFSFTDNVFQ